MLDWIRKRASTSQDGAKADADVPKRQASQMTGTFLPLYRYLENRYANTVVLTAWFLRRGAGDFGHPVTGCPQTWQ